MELDFWDFWQNSWLLGTFVRFGLTFGSRLFWSNVNQELKLHYHEVEFSKPLFDIVSCQLVNYRAKLTLNSEWSNLCISYLQWQLTTHIGLFWAPIILKEAQAITLWNMLTMCPTTKFVAYEKCDEIQNLLGAWNYSSPPCLSCETPWWMLILWMWG